MGLAVGSQHGESAWIIKHLAGKRGGRCVDVGAADGVHNSNIYELIRDHGWEALLIEPHPALFAALETTYTGETEDRVHLINAAVKCYTGRCALHQYGTPYEAQVSTTRMDFRNLVTMQHGDKFARSSMVPCVLLEDAVHSVWADGRVDFLNVDCEGSECEALVALLHGVHASLVCVELAMDADAIDRLLSVAGYVREHSIAGNAFYVPLPCSY